MDGVRLHTVLVIAVVGGIVAAGPRADAGLAYQTAPTLQCVPSPLDLGSVVIGEPPSNGTVTCTNNGRVRATVTAIQVTGPNAADFDATTSACLRTLSPGDSCEIPVAFEPGGAGARVARLELTIAQTPGGPVVVELRGTGIARDSTLSFDPASLTFAEQLGLTVSPPQTITVTNIGSIPVAIVGATIEGDHAADFAVASSTCTGVTLAPGEQCEIAVTFTPRAPGPRAALLRFDHDGSGAPSRLPLGGTGTTPVVLVTPAVGHAGEVISAVGVGFPANQVVTLRWVEPDTFAAGGFPEADTVATTAADGTFVSAVLVFPKSRVGTRALHAVVDAFASDGLFLVAPGTLQGPDFVVRG